MAAPHMVRGYGPLDRFLAEQRYRAARKRIKSAGTSGRILDIGCGCYPLFLMGADFAERYGLDKLVEGSAGDEIKQRGIHLGHYEIEQAAPIPFGNDYFDVVTMLAVFEHIEPSRLVTIHREIFRILKPGGMYIMTTPAFWTERLLRFLAKIRLVSSVEISEHKGSYHFSDVSRVLREASFEGHKVQCGYFEFFMNLWVTATK